MKLKPIPYQSGFIFVDESANIEKGDYYWDRWNDSVSNNSTETGRKMANENKTHYKIIAQHNVLVSAYRIELIDSISKMLPCGTTAYQDAYMDAAKEIINLIKQK